MTKTTRLAALAAALALGASAPAGAAELRGSLGSMKHQHAVAQEEGLAFARTKAQVLAKAEAGKLALVASSADMLVHSQVRHPYALPEVKLLLERLAAQYREATGERLVVTSLVRPRAEQPANAHRLSVHPAGMAVDLRVPANAASRRWLEQALLGMERAGVLDVTREFRPPHFHVAVYPAEYQAYAERRIAAETKAEQAARLAAAREGARLDSLAAAAQASVVATPAVDGGTGAGMTGALVAVLAALTGLAGTRRRRAARAE